MLRFGLLVTMALAIFALTFVLMNQLTRRDEPKGVAGLPYPSETSDVPTRTPSARTAARGMADSSPPLQQTQTRVVALVPTLPAATPTHVEPTPVLVRPTEPSPTITELRSSSLATPSPASTPPIPTVLPMVLTATPRPTPAPTQTPDPIARAVSKVAAAETQLRTGQLEVSVDFGNGVVPTARVTFDLGDEAHTPRIHISTTYQSNADVHTSDLIIIGSTAWERTEAGGWQLVTGQEGVQGQIQGYLPHIELAAALSTMEHDGTELRWYDAGRDTDVTLRFDDASGTPLELRQSSRAAGTTTLVIYRGWNAVVEIQAPAVNAVPAR